MTAILLVATYESGFQPLHLAQPQACLLKSGIGSGDLGLDGTDSGRTASQGISRRGLFCAHAHGLNTERCSGQFPALPVAQGQICFYGLYAGLNSEYLLDTGLADRVLAGEVEAELTTWAQQLAFHGKHRPAFAPVLDRLALPVPKRTNLPPLSQYAHFLNMEGNAVPAAQVVTSRGCLHTCGHCPVVPVYGGRFFVVDFETITADISQQVEAGARHISFGDPDFLNGPGHSLRVTEWLHQTYKYVTFDFTAKVEHLRRYPQHLASLKEFGAAFVVSAFESVQNHILDNLDKGHEVSDMEQVIRELRQLDLPCSPPGFPLPPGRPPKNM